MKAVFNGRKTTNIVLIGFMGAGKSTIAKILLDTLQIQSIDSDKSIEQHCQKSIVDLFRQSEAAFREQETKFLKDNLQKESTIFSLGGGIIDKTINRKLLMQLGIIFFLKTSFVDMWDRIKNSYHRPKVIDSAITTKNTLEQLYQKRLPIYQEIADFTISTALKEADSAQEIKQIYHSINGKDKHCQVK